MKIQIATTNILLGLTPTILSMMGSSTTELFILSTQRPLLALFVSLGSPTVWPMRPFEQVDLREEMNIRAQRKTLPDMSRRAGYLVALVQFTAVLASIANVTMIAYDLTRLTISYTFSCNQRYGPFLWVLLAPIIHVGGLFGFMSRLRYPSDDEQLRRGFIPFIRVWLRREVTPCIGHEPRKVIWKPENYWYLFFSFCATAGTVVHMVFGIVTLGSTQLVAAADAAIIIGRFLVSALVCRCVLMFELAGLRERMTVIVEKEDEGVGQNSTVLQSDETSVIDRKTLE